MSLNDGCQRRCQLQWRVRPLRRQRLCSTNQVERPAVRALKDYVYNHSPRNPFTDHIPTRAADVVCVAIITDHDVLALLVEDQNRRLPGLRLRNYFHLDAGYVRHVCAMSKRERLRLSNSAIESATFCPALNVWGWQWSSITVISWRPSSFSENSCRIPW